MLRAKEEYTASKLWHPCAKRHGTTSQKKLQSLRGKISVANMHPHVNHINMPAATTFLNMEAAGLCNIQVPAYQTTRYHIL
jgi:hypothetical protein